MDHQEFRLHAHRLVDWIADYLENADQYPVKSPVAPGDIINQLPAAAPQQGEAFEQIFADFQHIIMPGITHWQSPSFFAYFNANNSMPSVLGEMLTAALGAQCMSWQTSPAAAELEERVMQWLVDMLGLPPHFTGVIHDTASTATICSLISARECHTDYKVNEDGLYDHGKFRVYCSAEAHSSIEKAVKVIGLGKNNLVKIPGDENFAMQAEKLEAAILGDRAAGYVPLAVVAAFGTTGSTAIDPLQAVAEICRENHIWLHVDAAYAGTALLLPEIRDLIKGIEHVDTFVFNPHKWMFTNFDCCAYFVRSTEALVRSLEILPEYLKTREGAGVNNYRDWGLPLGRRFRALKLWFVIRSFGVEGLREKIRGHIQLAAQLAEEIKGCADFEMLAPTPFATLCFRYKPQNVTDQDQLNQLNSRLMETLNDSGKLYLTHTKLNGKFTLRMVIGQTRQQEHHVRSAWELIKTTAAQLPKS